MDEQQNEQLKGVVSNIIFACGGDTLQYDETINEVAKAVKEYIKNLTEVSLKLSERSDVVSPDGVIRALQVDPVTQYQVKEVFNQLKNKN